MDHIGERPRDTEVTGSKAELLESDPIAAILDVLQQGERFLVCSHSRPDGDAVGSRLAMRMLLHQMGKRAALVSADRIPAIYRNLPERYTIRTPSREHGAQSRVM